MRWPFRRNGGRPASPPSAAAPAAAPAGRRGGSRPSGAWTELPPLQPAANRLEVTAPSRAFVRELVTQRPHRGALESLGHDVSLDAPTGLAHIATAAPPRHADDEEYEVAWAPVPPVDLTGSPAAGWAEAPRPARRPTAPPPRTRAAQVHTPPTPRSLPVRNVPRPAESAVAPPLGPTAPAEPAGGTAPAEPAAAPATGRRPDRRPTVGAANLTTGHGNQRSPKEGIEPAPGFWPRNPARSGGIPRPERTDDAVQTDGETPEPPAALTPRTAAAPGHAPEAGPTSAAVGSELAPESRQNWRDSAASSQGRETVAEAADVGRPDVGDNAVSGSATAGRATSTQLAAESRQNWRDSAASSQGALAAPAFAVTSVETQPVVADTAVGGALAAADATTTGGRQQRAPITGHRALVPTASIHHTGRGVERTADGIPVYRGAEVSARARDLGARAFTEDGEIKLPREAGPIDQEPARSLLAHELVHAHQQRQLGDWLPPEETEEGRQLEAEAVRAERAEKATGSTSWEPRRPGSRGERPRAAAIRAPVGGVIAADTAYLGLNESHEDEAVGFTPPEERATAPAPAPAGVRPTAPAPAPAGAPPGRAPQRAPQRADQDGADPLEARGPAGTGEPREAAQGGDAAESGESDGDDVDSLIKKLYPQMLDRLRRDLVIERERAGRLIDRR